MKRTTYVVKRRQGGSALILSLIFIVMMSALAVGMATMSGTNVQVAENYRRLGTTRGCAESGLEVVKYWMNKVSFSGTTAPELRFSRLATSLQNELIDAGITNIYPVYIGSTITIANVPLDSSREQSFSATLTKISNDHVQLDVTGHHKAFQRTIRSNYIFGTRASTVFDFGVASKGPVALSGNVDLTGVTIDVESNAYIESENAWVALSIIGNSHIAGHVKIVNRLATVDLQGGQAGIGGETGVAATQEPYVKKGVPPAEFPEMSTGQFTSFVHDTMDADTDTSADDTYENIRIPANMNPTFSGHTTLKGIILVESPNVVEFTGGVDVTGIIVTDGDSTDDSGDSKLIFRGNVSSQPVATLPQEDKFAGLHSQAGTFIIAPGFHVSFGGSFDALSGAIAANGIEFFGNAGGTINGSIINYSDHEMVLSGNSDLFFNRSGLDEVPAGFVPETVLHYDPSSYAEILL